VERCRLARWTALPLVLLWASAGLAADDGDAARNRVSFGVESTREVDNDWVTAVVGATHEDRDPAQVADRINGDVAWALERAHASEGIQVRTAGYRTYPVDDPKNAQLRRLRGSQEIVLESGDPKALSTLLGELQSRLEVQSISFGVSPERRRAVEADLVDAALGAFRERAERVRAKLGARSYEIVQIQIDVSGANPPPMPMRGMLMRAEATVTPPALEAGSSTLRASAQATIQLGF
jgi:predicted secreted protein